MNVNFVIDLRGTSAAALLIVGAKGLGFFTLEPCVRSGGLAKDGRSCEVVVGEPSQNLAANGIPSARTAGHPDAKQEQR
jgi:hypothetical protein